MNNLIYSYRKSNESKGAKMEQAKQNRQDIEELKLALAYGYISYDEAKTEAKPILDRINKKGKEIAKKYGKHYYPITFNELMR